MAKLKTFESTVFLNNGETDKILIPAQNLMDAVHKLMSTGYSVNVEGQIVLSQSMTKLTLKEIGEEDVYLEFSKKHDQLLKGLRMV